MSDQESGSSTPGGEPQLILPGRNPGFMTRLRNYFLTGLVVAAPIGLTIWIVRWFIDLVDTWFTPLIPQQYQPDNYLPFDIPGLGLLIAFVLLTLLGALTANFFGRTVLNFGERLVARMPVVRSIYGALKQIFETVISQSAASFREVGLIEYPRKGLFCIVFITTQTKGEIVDKTGHELISVFLPTTPNPTSGFLLFVPKQDVQVLDMTIEEGAKLIISAGLVEPPRRVQTETAETVPVSNPKSA
ncbi:DUF502 domain-containing protein [Parvibaculum sp.]|jgi:uncharacterized membrane protein|uniref:DUF502 domain-containing protein n=1 Tax=Parvibaculum sp. TaxID=2024848 RepID=UPI000C4BA814|nr:DUF502 domain-containing protein [Parvibaculum sp.]HAC56902.1 hypothetical protein [Rhodobiaceae bacterium]MAU60334.1 hypothetical protein [Parvibaculum sp.]MBO6669298.1 DUF502 domain-containing protein [Parvibaculum sp.]MBO6693580.1 DUF502 domain-containing protein [Parvibaculum sp.]MBO6712936.1 DUF502 domain-containing protein [Parvibaculum sp.]|tara:strand:- start:3436 stop:4170 length:735 start_codon:yes stop_codon:yes gene_type:complete